MDTRDAAVSGWAQAYVDGQDHNATAVSGWAGSYADAGDAAVSGWASATFVTSDNDTTYTGDSGVVLQGTVFNANLVDYTVQSTAANSRTTTASRTYAVQVDSSDKLVVNVPWESGAGGGGISNVVEDTTPQLGGHLDCQSYHVSGVGLLELEGAFKTTLKSNTDGATVTFDLDAANTHTVTLGGNRTLALSNADVGQRFVIRLVQDGTGTRTVNWFSTIKWPGGLVPTLTTTGGKTDVFGFICTSAGNYDGFVIGYNL
jgi:hypothetical protein